MFEFSYQQGNARRRTFRCESPVCVLGSDEDCDLVIAGRHVHARHLELRCCDQGIFLTDLGSMGGTWVNKERTTSFGPLSDLDEVTIGDVSLWVHRVHLQNTNREHAPLSGLKPAPNPSQIAGVEHRVPLHVEDSRFLQSTSPVPVVVSDTTPNGAGALGSMDGEWLSENFESDEFARWCALVHERLLKRLDLRRNDVSQLSDEQLKQDSSLLIEQILGEMADEIPAVHDRGKLRQSVLDECVGLGPLEHLLSDDEITEIMVNNHQEIFIEKGGVLQRSGLVFSSDRAVYSVIDRIITPLGRRVDESSPIVDARLKDGSRVNAVIPPLALKGPSITIRRFPRHQLDFDALVKAGSIAEFMVDFLRVAVEMRRNIVVSGGTGAGKTTLLNVLSSFIPSTERIVTIEDAAELKLNQENIVSLESRPPNIEGRGEISIRELVKAALRMRPDRIVVGECRGGEAIDMLQAMNTGHDGSLTTIHANNPRDVISRLEVLVLMAGLDIPVPAIREQLASAVDLIIQQTRFPCGSRKVTRISEVVGVEAGTVQLQDVFLFRQSGRHPDRSGRVQGQFVPTGSVPTFYDDLRDIGVTVDLECFTPKEGRL